MDKSQIASFAKREIEPVLSIAGAPAYRCSAYLKDGLFLPCVLLTSAASQVSLATRRFQETREQERQGKAGQGLRYADIVKVFAAAGNRVNDYDIDRVETSPFAYLSPDSARSRVRRA